MVISPSGCRWVPELVQELESWCEPAIAHSLSWKASLVGVTSPLASECAAAFLFVLGSTLGLGLWKTRPRVCSLGKLQG